MGARFSWPFGNCHIRTWFQSWFNCNNLINSKRLQMTWTALSLWMETHCVLKSHLNSQRILAIVTVRFADPPIRVCIWEIIRSAILMDPSCWPESVQRHTYTKVATTKHPQAFVTHSRTKLHCGSFFPGVLWLLFGYLNHTVAVRADKTVELTWGANIWLSGKLSTTWQIVWNFVNYLGCFSKKAFGRKKRLAFHA